jgi:hypothetical protein
MPKLALRPKTLDREGIASSVLKKSFKKAKVSNVVVAEEQDFDGAMILRVSANVTPAISAAQLGDAIGEMRSAFAEEGLEYFVVLSIKDTNEDLGDVEE